MQIRQIKPSEIHQYCEGDRYAYSSGLSGKTDSDWLAAIDPTTVWAVFVNHEMVSALMLCQFSQIVRGQTKLMGGIGGVWTNPEFRNRGYARSLIEAVLAQMPQLRMGVSMLLPFKQSFYHKFGYVSANANLNLKIPLTALSHLLKKSSNIEQPNKAQIERFHTTNVRTEIQAYRQDLVENTTSDRWHGLVLPNLDAASWQWLYGQSWTVILRQDRLIVGSAIYTIDSQTDLVIKIKEIYWSNLAARDQLWGFFASHRDRIQDLELEVRLGQNFYAWLEDIPSTMMSKLNPHPWMVRVVDVERALNGLGANYLARIVIAVQDQQCSWNQKNLAIACDGNQLSTIETTEPWQVWLDIQALSALVYGTLPVAELVYAQLLRFADQSPCEQQKCHTILDNWFPSLILYNSFYY